LSLEGENKLQRLISLAIFLIFPLSNAVQAQNWDGLLAPNRAIDWSEAGPGTIPARETICATLGTDGQSASFSQSVTTTQIQSALSSCPAGQTVLLNPGTYNTSASLISRTSNVTLRGSGPSQTILKFTGTSTNCLGIGPTPVCIGSGDSAALDGTANILNWTAGYSRGTTTITAGSAVKGSLSNLKVGSLIILNQLDDSSDTGNAYFCGDTNCSQQGDHGNVFPGRSQIQIVTVKAINGNQITISPGLYAPNWNSNKTPYLTYSSSLPLSGFGLEDLQVNTQSLTVSNQAAMIQFVWATNSWIKNVAMINNAGTGESAHTHVWVAASSHIAIRDSYLYGASPTSQGYGVELWQSGDNLVENNICQHLPTCEILAVGSGNVFGYNYAVDNFYNGGGYAAGWQQCDQFHHDAGDYYNLWEGNIGICHTEDSIHGTAFANTVFRNALSGYDPALTSNGTTMLPKGTNTLTINNMAYARYQNYVANVLGYGGKATNYQYAMSSPTDCGQGSKGWIFAIGDSDQNVASATCGYGYSVQNDMTALGTLMRWGNWDAVHGSVQTNSSETGSSASVYPGLPSPSTSWSSYPSFYLGSQPEWWSFPSGTTAPWPGIGPDVTGGNISGASGHAYLNPAANCYLNVLGGKTDGSSGPRGFDGDSCYPTSATAGGPPPPPSNLTGTVQ
jgi:hypothetical protein